MENIKSQVRKYIEDNFLLGAGIRMPGDDDSFIEHHVLDSTGFLELVAYLEETYAIKIADQEMVPENLETLNRVGAFVTRKRGG
ncbi:MAG: acyl carrier protein [Rhodocyclales bacterium]|nr:acyl carrier protein [Rhodocyclales bacterium]